ncbi:exodeoxyribonuclease VII large subunit, partial [Cyanobium sp. N5-Cardenillas]|uniref:exodeoxyribonuclease VII large subunit n=1 Tax=Cyanobium sp. N5-Cardenillas TaxID=2823720 RepID=UPI0028F42DCE
PQRVGLITSRQSAAYSDIVSTIEAANARVSIYIADTVMQGISCEESILRSMACLENLDLDVVVIARGGGSRVDLSTLDNETVARRIASYRHPVWTAIGHDNDNSILDIVANQYFRTPTAVAEEIASRYQVAEQLIRDYYARLNRITIISLEASRRQLDPAFRLMRLGISSYMSIKKQQLEGSSKNLDRSWVRVYSAAGQRLSLMKSELTLFSKHIVLRCEERLREEIRLLHRACTYTIISATNTFDACKDRLRYKSAMKRIMNERQVLSGYGQTLVFHSNHSIVQYSKSLHWVTKDFSEQRLCKHLLSMNQSLLTFKMRMMTCTESSLSINERELSWLQGRLSEDVIFRSIKREREALYSKELAITNASPATTLARGYSIIYSKSGDIVKSCSQVRISESLKTELCDGVIFSQVSSVETTAND